jgi:cysteine sulfinate desulfinase/cysteine desulfurase-like protein
MGLDHNAAGECLRFSLSQATTTDEIDQAVEELSKAAFYVRTTLENAA